MPQELLQQLLDDLTIMAVMLSSENPFNPTEEELSACTEYAMRKIAEILEEWKEANGGRKIPIFRNKKGDEKDDE